MLVLVTESRRAPVLPVSTDAVLLVRDTWNDFGYLTTFRSFVLARSTAIELGKVKIAQFGMGVGATSLLDRYEEGLPEVFASLGEDVSYYQKLLGLPGELGAQALSALQDITINTGRYQRAVAEPWFETSFVRFSPALAALEMMRARADAAPPLPTINAEVKATLGGIQLTAHGEVKAAETALRNLEAHTAEGEGEKRRAAGFRISYRPPEGPKRLRPDKIVLDFTGPEKLPGRLIALVGPNGTGKTTLLSDLAKATFFRGSAQGRHTTYGELEVGGGVVGDVIFVSYSAFDTFEIPSEVGQDRSSELQDKGYVYVGLRKIRAGSSADPTKALTLKSIKQIELEFRRNLNRIRKAAGPRRAAFVSSIRDVFQDPSLEKLAPLDPSLSPTKVCASVREIFPSLSTGHKAILNIIAALCVHLKPASLVLMDEPEAHLHPPLVASLLKVIRQLLKSFDAYGVVATHSPVVVQETLGRHVIVLDRAGGQTEWQNSPAETFGENIGALTRQVFGLAAERSDYVARLRELVETDLGLNEIEALFNQGMSTPARGRLMLIMGDRYQVN